MSRVARALYSLGTLDQLATQASPVHSLDPRSKAWVTLAYIVTVMSFGSHDISGPLPLLFFPVVIAALGGIPPSCVGWRLLAASPFVLLLGMFNPWLDSTPMGHMGPWTLTAGWISFVTIVLRFVLTVSAAILCIAVTGFTALCAALPRMGVPHVFAVQLLFLYRYLFVLIHEGARMQRARELRACGRRGMGLASYAPLLGQLLLRTMDRGRRIHQAMLCRGFDGTLPLRDELRYTWRDALFIAGWLTFFVTVRCINLPQALGRTLTLWLTGAAA